MKNLVLLVAFIFMAASSSAFSYETHTKDCEQKFETTERTVKDVKSIDSKKTKKIKVKSE